MESFFNLKLYHYNGLGQRFSKNGVIYMYDLAGHLIGEYTNTGALIQETVWLNNLPIATIGPNGTGISVYFVHADELGTPRVVTDTTQKPVWRWDGDWGGRSYTTQTCLCCRVISISSPKGRAELGMREWICVECGTFHDRDINAARNILALGLERLAVGSITKPQ